MASISLFTGGIVPLPDHGRPTGIFKQPVLRPLLLASEGFAGDQQADRSVHGGPEKAVHLYPARHYARLAQRFPQIADQFKAGCLGENISSAMLDETQVRIGDIFQLGAARLQVCQPRNPCWKIDARFGVDGIAAFIAEQQLNGWYFRVLEPGMVAPGNSLDLVVPAIGAPTLAAALTLWHRHRPPPDDLGRLAATPGIATGWQRKIVERRNWLERHGGSELSPPSAFHVKPEK